MELNENDLFDDINVNGIVQMAFDLIEPMQYEHKRYREVTNQNYFEITIPRYNDQQFVEHFRMSRHTFQLLLNRFGNLNIVRSRLIPLEKKLLLTIWLLSKPESFLAPGDRFGLSKSSAHNIFNEGINLICQILGEYIRWSNNHARTINMFRDRSRGFPGIVGAIDGCHIPIKQPVGNAHDYFNRKQFHSIVLQGVCNAKAEFIDINVGQPGRMHDARVFRLSPLYQKLIDPRNPLLQDDEHIIGDTAYPLLLNLMKPYLDNGHLTQTQQIYNTKLSSVRSTVERAFGLLKVKFRRLKYLDVSTPETAMFVAAAACILHNFMLRENNPDDQYNINEDHPEIEVNNPDYAAAQNGAGIAENKRQNIVNVFIREL